MEMRSSESLPASRADPRTLLDHGLHVALAEAGETLDQGGPVDPPVVADHRKMRQAGSIHDHEAVVGRRAQPAHAAHLFAQYAADADPRIAEIVEQSDQPALQAVG